MKIPIWNVVPGAKGVVVVANLAGELGGAQQGVALAGGGEGLVIMTGIIIDLGDREAGGTALVGVAGGIGDDMAQPSELRLLAERLAAGGQGAICPARLRI